MRVILANFNASSEGFYVAPTRESDSFKMWCLRHSSVKRRHCLGAWGEGEAERGCLCFAHLSKQKFAPRS